MILKEKKPHKTFYVSIVIRTLKHFTNYMFTIKEDISFVQILPRSHTIDLKVVYFIKTDLISLETNSRYLKVIDQTFSSISKKLNFYIHSTATGQASIADAPIFKESYQKSDSIIIPILPSPFKFF